MSDIPKFRSAARVELSEQDKKFKKVVSDASSQKDIAATQDKLERFRQLRIRDKARDLISNKKFKQASKLLKRAMGKVPFLGGVAALASGDASAAVDADPLGPEKGSAAYALETGDVEGFKALMKEKKRQELIQRVMNKMEEK